MDVFKIFGEDDLRALPRGLWGIREPELEYMGRTRPTGQYPVRTPRDSVPSGVSAHFPLSVSFLDFLPLSAPSLPSRDALLFSAVRAKH